MNPQENSNRFRIGDRYRDRAWVLDTLGMSNATLTRRLDQHPNFPRPIEIPGTPTKRWIEREVYEYAQWLAGDLSAPEQSAAAEGTSVSDTLKPADREPDQATSQSVLEDSGAESSSAGTPPSEILRTRIKKSGVIFALNMGQRKHRTVEVQVKRTRVPSARDAGLHDSADLKARTTGLEGDGIVKTSPSPQQNESGRGISDACQGEEGQP